MPSKYIPSKKLPRKQRLVLVDILTWRPGDKGEKPKAATPEEVVKLIEHYRQRPFDMIRDGCLRIVNKDGDLVRFELNDEQDQVLSLVEQEYYAKRPTRIMVLKGRQIGMSTLNMACSFVLTITSSHKSSHLVTHRKKTILSLFRMFKNYYRYTPDCLKPKTTASNKDYVEFDDPDFGIEDCRIVVDTAENRDKLSLGWTFQFNNFSEKAFWPDQVLVAGALKPTIPKKWPSVIIEESTGDKFNDLFHTEYKEAKKGNKAGWHAVFFPVQSHKEYVLPLTVPEEEFLAAMTEDDTNRMRKYGVSLEFMNWYMTERDDWCSKNRETVAVFQRMYPMCEEEAFWGAGASFYDPAKLDRARQRVENQKLCKLEDLPESISLREESNVLHFARCKSIRNELSKYRGAAFMDSIDGMWIVWERPRKWYKYVVSVDIAEGKEKIKGVRQTNDYSVIDVTRYTYGPDELPAMVQVAQYRSQTIDPWELEREAMAVATMYNDFEAGRSAYVLPERNGPGLAFIGQGKNDGMYFYMKKRGQDKRGAETDTEEIGFQSTGGECQGARITVLIQGREVWEQGLILISSQDTISEMGIFSKNEKGKYEAQGTDHDDTIFAFTYGIECVRYLTDYTAPIPISAMRAKERQREEVLKRNEPPPVINEKEWLRVGKNQVEEEQNAELVGF